jgi:hypothetical protein
VSRAPDTYDPKENRLVKTFAIVVSGIVVAALVAGCAAEKSRRAAAVTPPPSTVVVEQTEGKGRVEQQEVTTINATVVSVDQKKRDVTLRGADGEVQTVHVGDEVRNLPQVNRGDRVVIKYYESLAFQLNKKGAERPGAAAVVGAERASLGAKPAGAVGDAVTVTALVTKVNRSKNTVSLKGPRGRTAVVHVKEPRYLENVKKGDTIDVTYTEALAIAVEPAS